MQLVASVRELRPLTEWSPIQDDGQQKPSRTTFGFVTNDYCAYFGQAAVGKWELTTKMVNDCLKRVPDDDIYPRAPAHITVASIATDSSSGLFVKGPKLSRYDELEGTGIASELLLHEAETLERLAHHKQHPNIIRYHGCIVERDRIVGIVLDRHPVTLQQRFTGDTENLSPDDAGMFDKDLCIKKIKSAVEHIHSLGLAHNDLNPSNIMLNQGEPIIIDFGSCQPFGKALVSAGTPGWVDVDCCTTSALRNDEVALDRIRTWLREGTFESAM
ncbi:hypothetical protein BU26DRAFT_440672 [Trematosphaeria pertusa]|uniref:Protein kinase domain-containing protein n=1 Tax=Trematosphaeria pertusa TaxID=390896 RepID=A0A6A6HU90_9PLEO|nr:uncharacterized protein BU26DRAFT_440672 [Trematosphaeria pertusa]KAF2241352.1 hypothetical protein BU26DRAFT_440672 [Trematosphaeria pertusa]